MTDYERIVIEGRIIGFIEQMYLAGPYFAKEPDGDYWHAKHCRSCAIAWLRERHAQRRKETPA